jgi:hypothetical protein
VRFPDAADEGGLRKLDNLCATATNCAGVPVRDFAARVDDVVSLGVNLKFVSRADIPRFWKSGADTLWNLNKVALPGNL